MASAGIVMVIAAAAAALIWNHTTKARTARLPPGPPSYPLLGQLLSVPTSFEQLKYKALTDDLKSDIISLQFLRKTIVVLGSSQAAIDLFEKRSTIYSDRPQNIILTDKRLIDWENAVPFTQYGERLRTYRRIFSTWLGKTATKTFHEYQVAQVRRMLRRFAGFRNRSISSDVIERQLHRLTTSTLLHATYGYEVNSMNDHFVILAKRAVDIVSQIVLPSNFLVNIFPSLLRVPEWVPGTGWRRLVRGWRTELHRTIEEPFEWAKGQVAAGIAQNSLVCSVLESLSKPGENGAFDLTEEDCKEVAVAIFGGGSDTMAGTLMAFILAMALFPEAQAMAQREIDSVIGNSRLPEISDVEDLPYVRSLIQEVMRWRPALPLGIPHASSQDDVFQGYEIPKGSIIYLLVAGSIGNIWAMTRDVKLYQDPETFNPNRFLDPNVPPPPIFGWGRRKCPGMYFAESLVFVCIASILAGFNIKSSEETQGRELHFDIPANGIIYRPKPFSCIIAPRSQAHEELIHAATYENM
ncbi:cytochrome P450 family protein [Ceratobasidium sp. AG-Ba]|nr:cytochrome P450 family protein [Ceratobasidium sp. AG-Ba]